MAINELNINSNILIVDDEPLNIKSLFRILAQPGVQIYSATNGQDALDLLGEYQIDLILLDVMMPVLNGFQLCEKIQSSPQYIDIPIIFLTGCSDIEDKIKGLKTGAIDYVTKPFEAQEVFFRVKNYIKLKKAQDQIKEYNKNLEKILKERTRKLIQTERQAAVSLSIQGILHNLKNPLTGIIGGTEIISEIIESHISTIERDQSNKEQLCDELITKISKNKNLIEKSSGKLMDIINSILIKGHKDRSTEFEIFNLNEMISQEKNYIDADNYHKVELQIKTKLHPTELYCYAIPVEIAQIFHNLVKNAIDAAYEKQADLQLIIKTGENDNTAWFEIVDNGPGISVEIQSHIFEPFFTSKQLENSDTNKTKGSGLGLYSCWELTTSNKGSIQLIDTSKEGTTFRVNLQKEKLK